MRRYIHAVPIMFALVATASAEPRIDALGETLPDVAKQALDRIPDQGRKLLAMRSYLRSARSLETRWSWTQAQIDAYEKSDQYVTAMAGVAAITTAFELKNPGYTLHVNKQVRSLDEQIEKWNANGSVKAAGAAIDEASAKWLTENPEAKPEALKAFLTDWKPPVTASLAAPGLTAHGRGAAFDFQVAKDGAVIAGADTGAVTTKWQGEGWGTKLADAVRLSTFPFEGPLKDPDEPWHYDYKPAESFKPPPAVAEAPATGGAATRPWAGSETAATPVLPVSVPTPQEKPAEAAVASEAPKATVVKKAVKKASAKRKKKSRRRR